MEVEIQRSASVVECAFTDSGAGLTEEAADRVFEPFFTTKARGAGLGLHNVRNIMQLHGGRVRFEPVAAGGTRCVLVFPLIDERPVETPERRPA